MISTTVSPRSGSSEVFQAVSKTSRISAPGDRPVVGIEHRNQPDVRRALHVVLAAQRVQPGAGTADLAGHQRERDQAARVVGAVDVLRDAHPPEDDGGGRGGVFARDGADGRRVDAADRRHLLRREGLDMRLQRLEPLGVASDIVWVVEPLGDDRVHHRIEESHVGAGLELQHVGRVPAERLAARVHDDQGLARLGRVLEERRRHGVIHRGVGADDDDRVRVGAFEERRGHGARVDGLHQRGDRGGMTKPGAVIDVVGAEACPHQLLEQIGLLVRALGRAEPGERLASMRIADAREPGRGGVQRLLPARLAEQRERVGRIQAREVVLADPLAADHRRRDALRVVHVVEAEPSLDAQPAAICRPVPPSTLTSRSSLMW